jgi:hypothetical protein
MIYFLVISGLNRVRFGYLEVHSRLGSQIKSIKFTFSLSGRHYIHDSLEFAPSGCATLSVCESVYRVNLAQMCSSTTVPT